MHLLPEDDLISLNFYYRNKLKKSLTYLIFCGYFDKIRSLIESSAHFKKTNKKSTSTAEDASSLLTYISNQNASNNSTYQANSLNEINEKIDLNETDEWWIDLPSSIIKKTFNSRPYRPTLTNPLLNNNNHSSNKEASLSTSSQLRHSMNEAMLKDKGAIKTRGRTPLMLCSLIDDPAWSYSIAQNLIEKGASLSLKDSNGFNALMYASLYERTHIIELFLNAPSDYNMLSTDPYGNTVFHLASLGKCQKNCSLLHQMSNKFGIDPFSQVGKNFFGHTPYDICKLNK
jgi:ankyrin repeat protein